MAERSDPIPPDVLFKGIIDAKKSGSAGQLPPHEVARIVVGNTIELRRGGFLQDPRVLEYFRDISNDEDLQVGVFQGLTDRVNRAEADRTLHPEVRDWIVVVEEIGLSEIPRVAEYVNEIRPVFFTDPFNERLTAASNQEIRETLKLDTRKAVLDLINADEPGALDMRKTIISALDQSEPDPPYTRPLDRSEYDKRIVHLAIGAGKFLMEEEKPHYKEAAECFRVGLRLVDEADALDEVFVSSADFVQALGKYYAANHETKTDETMAWFGRHEADYEKAKAVIAGLRQRIETLARKNFGDDSDYVNHQADFEKTIKEIDALVENDRHLISYPHEATFGVESVANVLERSARNREIFALSAEHLNAYLKTVYFPDAEESDIKAEIKKGLLHVEALVKKDGAQLSFNGTYDSLTGSKFEGSRGLSVSKVDKVGSFKQAWRMLDDSMTRLITSATNATDPDWTTTKLELRDDKLVTTFIRKTAIEPDSDFNTDMPPSSRVNMKLERSTRDFERFALTPEKFADYMEGIELPHHSIIKGAHVSINDSGQLLVELTVGTKLGSFKVHIGLDNTGGSWRRGSGFSTTRPTRVDAPLHLKWMKNSIVEKMDDFSGLLKANIDKMTTTDWQAGNFQVREKDKVRDIVVDFDRKVDYEVERMAK